MYYVHLNFNVHVIATNGRIGDADRSVFNSLPDQTLCYLSVVESEDHDQTCMFINTGLSCIVMELMCDRRKYKRKTFLKLFFFLPRIKS